MSPLTQSRFSFRLLLAAIVVTHATGCGSPDLSIESSAESSADTSTFSFETVSDGAPAGWKVATTNAEEVTKDARWQIQPDASSASPSGVLALVDTRGHTGHQFNLCWEPTVSIADVDLSVDVRAGGGTEDQGGGPAWRIAGASDYYAARWNPLEDNFRVYSIVAGERFELDSAEVKADADTWHTIRVRQVGTSITCWFDDKELLHAEDAKVTAAGAVGLWTKADATTSFDDLFVKSAP